MKQVRISQIGLGHWGPNLFRNFFEHEAVTVDFVCDLDPIKLNKVSRYNVGISSSTQEMLASDSPVEAVVVATPVHTHFELAKNILKSGRHVFVEKPMAASSSECRELTALAADNRLILMVGHVFLFNPGIEYIREMINSGELGKILFIHTQRTNLGPIREDVNAFWDLASHDISIVNYWLDASPEKVSVSGSKVLGREREDVVSANVFYPNGVSCNMLVSWIHPRKVRQITVVGERKMVVWDDMRPNESIRIYDKRVELQDLTEQVEGTYSEFKFSILDGDISIPKIRQAEPLKAECNHFVQCLLENKSPLVDAQFGTRIVECLEATDRSIAAGGACVTV